MEARGKEIADPEVPWCAEYLWSTFWALSGHRMIVDGVPQPIQASEAEAWCRLSGRQLRPWEWRALEAMDLARLETSGARTEEEPAARRVVSMSDSAGVRDMMRSAFGARLATPKEIEEARRVVQKKKKKQQRERE